MAKYLDKSGLQYFYGKLKEKFADKTTIEAKLDSLTGAFLWKGKFDTLPPVDDYEAGNVVGVKVGENAYAEYVLTVVGNTKTWEKLGDEGSYLLKTTAEETYLKKAAGEVKTDNLADKAVTSTKLATGARKPIILTPETTQVDEETYQKLLSGNDVVFKDNNEIIWECITHGVEDGFTLRFGRFRVSTADEYKIYTEECWVQISTEAPHGVKISKYENAVDVDNSDYLYKSTLTPVLKEIDLTGTDAERKAKFDQFETDWKALTGAGDLAGARFVGQITTLEGGFASVLFTYNAGIGTFTGVTNLDDSDYRNHYSVYLNSNGELTITPLFQHLEAITIKIGNTTADKGANKAAIKAYVDNLKALGVDITKGYSVPCKYNDNNYIGVCFPTSTNSMRLCGIKPVDITTGVFVVIETDGTYKTEQILTVNKNLSSLTTTSKNIAGAINEVNTLAKGKQDTLTSGTNIKTVNGQSLLGSGNIATIININPGTSSITGNNISIIQNAVVGTVTAYIVYYDGNRSYTLCGGSQGSYMQFVAFDAGKMYILKLPYTISGTGAPNDPMILNIDHNSKTIQEISISGGSGDVTAAGDNTFTGINTFTSTVIVQDSVLNLSNNTTGNEVNISEGSSGKLYLYDQDGSDIEILGVKNPSDSNCAANKSYVDTQISTALGTVLTQLQNI